MVRKLGTDILLRKEGKIVPNQRSTDADEVHKQKFANQRSTDADEVHKQKFANL